MSNDEIIEMARQAGFLTNELKSYVISPYTFEDQDLYEEIEAFAKLVADKARQELREEIIYTWVPPHFVDLAVENEREECAKVCDDADKYNRHISREIALAIRARGEA